MELVQLVVGAGAARRLKVARWYLDDAPETLALEELARKAPEDFGLVGSITLGADVIYPERSSEPFADRLWIHGIDLIDGYQRLKAIAVVLDELGPAHLADMLLKVEVYCGAERERARRLHGYADTYQSFRDAQDRLSLCPNIRRLMEADWERWSFDVRRGVTTRPSQVAYSMAEVTRALACVSGPGPGHVHRVVSADGLMGLWDDRNSFSYRTLFHSRMSPLGIMRAVAVKRAAQGALEEIPKSRQKGHGLLIKYAPDLLHWASCRFLPLDRLHDESFPFDWHETLQQEIRKRAQAAVSELIRRYEELVPASNKKGTYSETAPVLSLWTELTDGL
ncbi:hypothetical protein [Streptomyces sp. CB02460]|uniref:hypothetical protein n=1 Tax=Streptomyces sp. CB02460 TaxID=1703941 RepID=UPI001161370E|nr:hypothetical protein [Streptomyces sp. CB02460]